MCRDVLCCAAVRLVEIDPSKIYRGRLLHYVWKVVPMFLSAPVAIHNTKSRKKTLSVQAGFVVFLQRIDWIGYYGLHVLYLSPSFLPVSQNVCYCNKTNKTKNRIYFCYVLNNETSSCLNPSFQKPLNSDHALVYVLGE
jgi:hypothetical protein